MGDGGLEVQRCKSAGGRCESEKGMKGDRGPEKEREVKGDREVGAFYFCHPSSVL